MRDKCTVDLEHSWGLGNFPRTHIILVPSSRSSIKGPTFSSGGSGEDNVRGVERGDSDSLLELVLEDVAGLSFVRPLVRLHPVLQGGQVHRGWGPMFLAEY